MRRNLKLFHMWRNKKKQSCGEIWNYPTCVEISEFSASVMHRNLKFLHKPYFSPQILVGLVTNIRYASHLPIPQKKPSLLNVLRKHCKTRDSCLKGGILPTSQWTKLFTGVLQCFPYIIEILHKPLSFLFLRLRSSENFHPIKKEAHKAQ